MKQIKWYLERLKAMEQGEIRYRINQIIKQKRIELSLGEQKSKIKKLYISNDKLIEIEFGLKKYSLNTDELQKITSDGIDLNDTKVKIFEETIYLSDLSTKWHGTVNQRPNDIYSWKYNFQDVNYEDVRKTWELNRHYFMPYLALKSFQDKNFEEFLTEIFYDWKKKNPFLKGVNWSSSMEVALRAYQWFWTLVFLIEQKNYNKSFIKEIIADITFSINFVNDNYSKYSSANNHLLIERMIVYYIVTNLSEMFEEPNKIKDECRKDLDAELVKQFFEDGLNKEQALHYHAFVLEMWIHLNWMLVERKQSPVQENLLKNAIEAFLSFRVSDGIYCDFGDSDEGKIIDFTNSYQGYREINNLSLDYLYKTNASTYSKLFLYSSNDLKFVENTRPHELKEYGGNFIFKNEDIFLHFDVSNLGYKSLAAHGHADALSIQLFIDEVPIFVDKGTYIYNGNIEKRNYYRSTKAHNTVVYQERNQSNIKGPFLWGDKAEIVSRSYHDGEIFLKLLGSHNGYLPYHHTREININKNNSSIEITDELEEKFDAYYHLHPDVSIQQVSDNIIILNNTIFFESDEKIELLVTPFSPSFGVEKNTNTIKIKSYKKMKVCIKRRKENEKRNIWL